MCVFFFSFVGCAWAGLSHRVCGRGQVLKEETLRSGVLPMLMQQAIIVYASTPEIGENPCASIINGMWQGEHITGYAEL